MQQLIKQILGAGLVLAASLGPVTARADYPDHTVRIIVPYPPGAFNDTLGRVSAEKLGKLWGQSVVVENKPGGNTTIGNTFVAKSPPDGYTILVSPLPFSSLPGLYGDKLPYDAIKDFTPLIQAGPAQNVLVVRTDSPFSNVQDILDYAKKNPGKLNYGSTGSGSSNHLSMELFKSMTATQMTHVPYKGSAPAVMALMGGELDLMFDNIPNVMNQLKAGKLKAIAVTGSKRSSMFPAIPTVAEAGVPGYEVNVWFGMQLPAGTPPAIVNKLNKDLVKILTEQDVVSRFADVGVEVVAGTPEEFAALIRSEIPKWTKVIKQADIKVE